MRLLFADRLGGKRDLLERVCPFEVVMLGQTREGGWPVNDVAYFEDVEWTTSASNDTQLASSTAGNPRQ